jgi:hypothetical protein
VAPYADDGWAQAKATPGKGVMDSAYETTAAAAKAAYGTVTGNTEMADEGKRVFYGSNAGSS